MDNKEQVLKDLISKHDGITKRISDIPEEIVATEKRIKERESDLNQTLKDIEKAREERQKLLVNGGKIGPLSGRIKDLWERCDLIEDEILGLKTRVRELQDEGNKLVVEKDLCRDEIISAKVSPLLEKYNKNAQAVSETLKGILSIMDEYSLPYGLDGWGRFISCSSWLQLRVIPRLSRACDEPGKDFFNITEIMIKRQQEQLEKAYKQSTTPCPEA